MKMRYIVAPIAGLVLLLVTKIIDNNYESLDNTMKNFADGMFSVTYISVICGFTIAYISIYLFNFFKNQKEK